MENFDILSKKDQITNEQTEWALSTIDNPYDPFTQFDEWFQFDNEKGYNSCGYLARIAMTSNAFSNVENNEEIERAIDEIIKYDFMKIYIKVHNKNFDNL